MKCEFCFAPRKLESHSATAGSLPLELSAVEVSEVCSKQQSIMPFDHYWALLIAS